MRFVVKEVQYTGASLDVTTLGDKSPVTISGPGTVTVILEAPEYMVNSPLADLPKIGEIIEIADQVGAEPPSAASLIYPPPLNPASSVAAWRTGSTFGSPIYTSPSYTAPDGTVVHVNASQSYTAPDGTVVHVNAPLSATAAETYVERLKRLHEAAKRLEATKWVGDAPKSEEPPCPVCGVVHHWAAEVRHGPPPDPTLIGPRERRRIRRREKRAARASS